VRGYALRTPWGLGPAIPTHPADGQRLLDVLLRHPHPAPRISLAVPTDNYPARAHLAPRVPGARTPAAMVLGALVPWRPEAIWAIFNFATG
jgi:hypothetical protein